MPRWHHALSQVSTYLNIYLHVMGFAQTDTKEGIQFNKLVVTLILQLSELRQYLRFLLKYEIYMKLNVLL